jgi:flagellar hook-associated protein 1 FlgK
MSALNIGLSGLLVNQRLLDLTGQNITNANTPGYHRQLANLAEAAPHAEDGLSVGTGVEITGLTRSVNQALEQAVVSNTSASNNASTQLDGLNQLQTFLATGSGTLHDALGNLFTQLEALSTEPSDPTQRQVVLSAAADVTNQLNGTEANIAQMTGSLSQQAAAHVDAINGLTAQIAQLNQQIHDATISGADTNGLLDQRDQALGSLADLVDVHTLQQPYGEISVFTGGDALVLGNQAAKLTVGTDNQGKLAVSSSMALHPLEINGGQLGGVLELYNTTLPDVRTRLDTFAQALAAQFDHIHATGLGLSGPMTSLTSLRTVTHVNQPLSAQNLDLPAQAGDLYITVTNLATGQRTLNRVTIDPKTQSLSAIAAAISAVPNMQAVVDAHAGTLNLLAKPGYGFDFTGNLSSAPDTQAITGTTTASVDGQYTGSTNGSLQFSFAGSGTIGLTPNLMLQVRDGAGTLLGSVNVGQGYSPGTDVATVLGVNVKLASGTVNAGDSFNVNVAANPDSANLLTALGLNTFFAGSSAADLAVNPNLVSNPQELALSTSGQPGDSANLAKLTALQTQPVLANQTQSLQQYLESIIGDVGAQANTAQTSKNAYDTLGQQLNDQLQSVSGVDPNEELMRLVQYQQSYQMSAQFIATVKKTFDDFLHMF